MHPVFNYVPKEDMVKLASRKTPQNTRIISQVFFETAQNFRIALNRTSSFFSEFLVIALIVLIAFVIMAVLLVRRNQRPHPGVGKKLAENAALKIIPDEIMLEIFNYLPIKSLFAASEACQRFNRLAFDSSLWEKKLGGPLPSYPVLVLPTFPLNRKCCIEHASRSRLGIGEPKVSWWNPSESASIGFWAEGFKETKTHICLVDDLCVSVNTIGEISIRNRFTGRSVFIDYVEKGFKNLLCHQGKVVIIYEKILLVWDLNKRCVIYKIPFPSKKQTEGSFQCKDGKIFILNTSDTIKIFDILNGSEIKVEIPLSWKIKCLLVADTILYLGVDNTIRRICLETKNELDPLILTKNKREIHSLHFVNNTLWVESIMGNSKTLKKYNAPSADLGLVTMYSNSASLKFSDGFFIIVDKNGHSMKIVNSTRNNSSTFEFKSKIISHAVIQNTILVIGFKDGTMQIWDLSTTPNPTLLNTLSCQSPSPIISIIAAGNSLYTVHDFEERAIRKWTFSLEGFFD